MKRTKLIKHLFAYKCILKREGSNHTIFQNPETGKKSAVPKHNEIGDMLCNEICKQLDIPTIK